MQNLCCGNSPHILYTHLYYTPAQHSEPVPLRDYIVIHSNNSFPDTIIIITTQDIPAISANLFLGGLRSIRFIAILTNITVSCKYYSSAYLTAGDTVVTIIISHEVKCSWLSANITLQSFFKRYFSTHLFSFHPPALPDFVTTGEWLGVHLIGVGEGLHQST